MKVISYHRIFFLTALMTSSCTTAYQPEPLKPHNALKTLNTIPPGRLSFTLAQAQALAVLQHPTLRTLRAERGFVEAAEIRVDVRPDPEISLSPLWIIPQATLGGVASLRWELLPSGTKEARRGLAGALKESFDEKIAAAEWQIAQEARVAWLELVKASKTVQFSEQAVTLSREGRDFGRSMLERGAARSLDVAVLELDYAEAERELVVAKASIRSAQERLAEAVGFPPGAVLEITTEQDPFEALEANIPEGDSDAALLTRLPQLREAHAQYLVAEKELELAYLAGLPKVSVGPDAQRDADSTFLGGGATVSIPSTDANRVGIAEAKTRRELAAKHYEELLFESRATLAKARAEEILASQALRYHESTVAPRSKETLEAADRAVQVGVSDLLPLFLARERALRAERTGLELRASRAVAIARLEAAFGPEPISQENKFSEQVSSSINGGVR